jgi:hypothetical protein
MSIKVLGAVDLTAPRATEKAEEIASLQNHLASNTHTHTEKE